MGFISWDFVQPPANFHHEIGFGGNGIFVHGLGDGLGDGVSGGGDCILRPQAIRSLLEEMALLLKMVGMALLFYLLLATGVNLIALMAPVPRKPVLNVALLGIVLMGFLLIVILIIWRM